MKPGEHKTFRDRILGCAEATGWTIVSRQEDEQRRGNNRTLIEHYSPTPGCSA